MKTTEAACIGEELCCLLRKEDVGQIVGLGGFHIERVRGCLHILQLEWWSWSMASYKKMLKTRLFVSLEASGLCAIPT